MAFASAAVASAQSLSDIDFDAATTTTTRFATARSTSTRSSTSAFWTVTARYAEQISESPFTYYDNSVVTDTYTETRTLKDNVTPTVSPYLLTTSYNYYYSDVEMVEAYYTTGVVAESDLVPESTYDYYSTPTTTVVSTTKIYSMPVTMTAPASCPTPCMYPTAFYSIT